MSLLGFSISTDGKPNSQVRNLCVALNFSFSLTDQVLLIEPSTLGKHLLCAPCPSRLLVGESTSSTCLTPAHYSF